VSREDHLFNNADWFSVDRHQRAELQAEVDAMEGNRLLNTSIDDLAAYLVDKYQVNVPELNREGIVADQRETKIDVSRDPMRMVLDRGQPCYVAGTEVHIEVPFSGDTEAFKIQPTTYSMNPPRAEIRNKVLLIKISGTNLTPEKVKSEVERTLTSIEGNLKHLRTNAEVLNRDLPNIARSAIDRRRKNLLDNQSLVSSLGFNLKEREGAPKTYSAPEIKRKIRPSLPPASSAPFKPEPTLTTADYEHILSVIESMALVMERSPSAFHSMDEESLRSHFLVQLNGHYEGQATGETFNYEGKTDILIRAEGQNIFIAECKFWGGPKVLIDTIDQILGYSSWRDTKIAIVIFSRNKGFTKVLESMKVTTLSHPNCKRELPLKKETSSRFLFAHRDDPNRELTLTILAFDVPRKDAA